jgi:hypothetical protein
MVRKLVLHAADPLHTLVNPAVLIEALAGIGLTGAALPAPNAAFEAGEAFLSLITFLGCSPQVEFQPADEMQRVAGHYCHVRYALALAEPVFRAAPGRLQPRCRHCRTPVADWSGLVQGWPHQAPPHADCAQCGQPLRAAELNWRQAAGFGCWFVEIWNIHPHEAVPSEQLIAVLEREADTLVRYFYE